MKYLFRVILSPAILLIFGVNGLVNMWRFGGNTSVKTSKEFSPHEAITVLESKIAEYKQLSKNPGKN